MMKRHIGYSTSESYFSHTPLYHFRYNRRIRRQVQYLLYFLILVSFTTSINIMTCTWTSYTYTAALWSVLLKRIRMMSRNQRCSRPLVLVYWWYTSYRFFSSSNKLSEGLLSTPVISLAIIFSVISCIMLEEYVNDTWREWEVGLVNVTCTCE